jgi:hypothetical protein
LDEPSFLSHVITLSAASSIILTRRLSVQSLSVMIPVW